MSCYRILGWAGGWPQGRSYMSVSPNKMGVRSFICQQVSKICRWENANNG